MDYPLVGVSQILFVVLDAARSSGFLVGALFPAAINTERALSTATERQGNDLKVLNSFA